MKSNGIRWIFPWLLVLAMTAEAQRTPLDPVHLEWKRRIARTAREASLEPRINPFNHETFSAKKRSATDEITDSRFGFLETLSRLSLSPIGESGYDLSNSPVDSSKAAENLPQEEMDLSNWKERWRFFQGESDANRPPSGGRMPSTKTQGRFDRSSTSSPESHPAQDLNQPQP